MTDWRALLTQLNINGINQGSYFANFPFARPITQTTGETTSYFASLRRLHKANHREHQQPCTVQLLTPCGSSNKTKLSKEATRSLSSHSRVEPQADTYYTCEAINASGNALISQDVRAEVTTTTCRMHTRHCREHNHFCPELETLNEGPCVIGEAERKLAKELVYCSSCFGD